MGWILVGKVKDAQGLKGELFVHVFSGEAAWAPDLVEFALLKTSEESIEEVAQEQIFECEYAKPHKTGIRLKPKSFTNRNQSEAVKGQFLYIHESDLVSEEGEEIYLREIEGFKVIDKHLGEVGKITGFSFNGGQDLLVVETNQKTVEIPFVESFIIEIDWDNEVVNMDLPPGITDLESLD
jgi:16S rRNA processing protein RimM